VKMKSLDEWFDHDENNGIFFMKLSEE